MSTIERLEPRFGHAHLPLLRDAGLSFVLVRREVMECYRGSLLGVLWSLITPLLMLGVYTFVFGSDREIHRLCIESLRRQNPERRIALVDEPEALKLVKEK